MLPLKNYVLDRLLCQKITSGMRSSKRMNISLILEYPFETRRTYHILGVTTNCMPRKPSPSDITTANNNRAQEVRAGLLERKSKYLKSYTAGW
jgi:hypothetical protein